MERADRNNIELLEFRPEKANRNIIMCGEALDKAALTAYMEALAGQPSLTKLYLLHLQTMKREKLTTVALEQPGLCQDHAEGPVDPSGPDRKAQPILPERGRGHACAVGG